MGASNVQLKSPAGREKVLHDQLRDHRFAWKLWELDQQELLIFCFCHYKHCFVTL